MNHFQTRCERVAFSLDLGVVFFEDDRPTHAFEDDGNLHVVHNGLRACFDVRQNDNIPQQNSKTEAILNGLGMRRFIGPATLIDKTEEDDS